MMRQAELAQQRAAAALPLIPAELPTPEEPVAAGSISSAADLLSAGSDTGKEHGRHAEHDTHEARDFGFNALHRHGLNLTTHNGHGTLGSLNSMNAQRIHLAPKDRISTAQCWMPMLSVCWSKPSTQYMMSTTRHNYEQRPYNPYPHPHHIYSTTTLSQPDQNPTTPRSSSRSPS